MARILFYIACALAFVFLTVMLIRISYLKRKINKNLLTRKEYRQKFRRLTGVYSLLTVLFLITAGYFLGHDAFATEKELKEKKTACLKQNKSYYVCTWSNINNYCYCEGKKYQGVSDTMRG